MPLMRILALIFSITFILVAKGETIMFVYKPDCVKICHFMKHLSDVSQQGFYDLVKTS